MSEILNPGTVPIVYSNDARVIAAGERLADTEIDEITRAALDRGDLVEIALADPAARLTAVGSGDHADAALGAPAPEHAG